MKTHHGSCHCGAVHFEAEANLARVTRCNCRICTKLFVSGCMVAPTDLRVTKGEPELATYGNDWARRYFCKTCHVYLFSRGNLPALGGEFASINVNSLDDVDPHTLTVQYFDGRHDNWHAGTRPEPWPMGL